MSEKETREQILDLLARGKISIDDAVEMLDNSAETGGLVEDDEPLYKAEVDKSIDIDSIVKIKQDEKLVQEPEIEKEKSASEIRYDGDSQQARWLRVQVSNSETGKRKVSVNIPMAMVKFGINVARVFSPEMKNVDLEEVDTMLNHAEAGLLVDVQDDESNEHVKIFFD